MRGFRAISPRAVKCFKCNRCGQTAGMPPADAPNSIASAPGGAHCWWQSQNPRHEQERSPAAWCAREDLAFASLQASPAPRHARPRGSTIQMKALAEFSKTTLIGGILIVLPIYVSLLLLAKAAKGLLALLSPITAAIPASVEFSRDRGSTRARRRLFRRGGDRAYRSGPACEESLRAGRARKASRLCAAAGPRRTLHRSGETGPHLRRRSWRSRRRWYRR